MTQENQYQEISYLEGLPILTNDDFTDLVEKTGKSEDQIIHDMVYSGWMLGMSENWEIEFWPPSED